MEQRLDNFIDSFFGGMGSGLMIFNGVLGLALIVVGIILMKKKSSSKNKNIAGIVCVGIGILAIISGIVQTVLK